MKFGGIALVPTKWHISLLRYGTLFLLISVIIKTDTNNFIFSAKVTQKFLVGVIRYVKTQHH
jgi:hypothetical protein